MQLGESMQEWTTHLEADSKYDPQGLGISHKQEWLLKGIEKNSLFSLEQEPPRYMGKHHMIFVN